MPTAPVLRAAASTCLPTAATAVAFALYGRVEWPWFALGWIGLVPWLAQLDRARTWRRTLGVALLMSVAFVLAMFGWFASAIQHYTEIRWTAALLLLVLIAPLIQPQFIVFALARHAAQRWRAGFWSTTVAGAGLYVGCEWALPKLFADTIGHGFYASSLMRQAADVAGAHGLTCVLIVANECALATVQTLSREWVPRTAPSLTLPRCRRPALSSVEGGQQGRELERDAPECVRPTLAPEACVVALVFLLLAYGAVRIRQLTVAARPAPVTAAIVQADISQYGRLAARLGTFDAVRTILDAHFALSAQALSHGGVDLLLWPETVYPTTFGSPKSDDGAAFDREIAAFVNRTHVPLVFGAYDVEDGNEFNAAVFLEPAVEERVTFDTYRKASLFPFTERVPALLDADAMRRWLPWLGTWRPGDGPQVLLLTLRDGRRLRVAPLICYDAVDPTLSIAAARYGAELIVTLSNDSWFATGKGPRLHLVVSAFRSLETRLPQVRATNTGISAVITPTGDMPAVLGVHQRGVLVQTVSPAHGPRTLMLAWGDWFGPTALLCGSGLLATSYGRRRRGPVPALQLRDSAAAV
jgi:apolipoprotein N-acyltransferase